MRISLALGIVVLAVSALGAAVPQAKASTPIPPVNDYAAWAAFQEGAWVTMEKDYRGEHKVTFTKTLSKKSPDEIRVKEEDEKKKDPNPDDPPPLILPIPGFENGEWHYKRVSTPFPCPTCRKEHKPSQVTPRKPEKLKIGAKEVTCTVWDVVPYDCDDTSHSTSRWWISKDVPGGLVRREDTIKDKPGKVIDQVLDFDKKKKVESGQK